MGVLSTSQELSSPCSPTFVPHKCKYLVSWNSTVTSKDKNLHVQLPYWSKSYSINSTLTFPSNMTLLSAQLLTCQGLSSRKDAHLGSILKALFSSHPNILNLSKDSVIFIWIPMRHHSHIKKKKIKKSTFSWESPVVTIFISMPKNIPEQASIGPSLHSAGQGQSTKLVQELTCPNSSFQPQITEQLKDLWRNVAGLKTFAFNYCCG